METANIPELVAPDRFSVGRLEPAKVGLVLFIALEIMFFAGLISAFLMFRMSPVEWPPAGQPRLPVLVTAFNTLILLWSGWSFHKAIRALRSDCYVDFLEGVEWALWPGLLFLIIQGSEWVRLIHFGLTLSSGVFGGFFYLLVGFHALHAAAGVFFLAWVRHKAYQAEYMMGSHLGAELCGIYWTFVVGLWPILFVLIYL